MDYRIGSDRELYHARGHKYILRYKNRNGNWTYVYNTPKNREKVQKIYQRRKEIADPRREAAFYARQERGDKCV